MVRYRVHEARVAEHERLIEGVFAELARVKPAGLHYGAFKQPDGVSFVHVASVAVEPNPLTSLPAFKEFTAGIKDRCAELPVTIELAAIGTYGGGS